MALPAAQASRMKRDVLYDDGDGVGAVCSAPDGSFVVASPNAHECNPARSAPLALKAVLEGEEEYLVNGAHYRVSPGRFLLIAADQVYESRVRSRKIRMCPIFLESGAIADVAGVSGGKDENRLLESERGKVEIPTTLLPRDAIPRGLIERIWDTARAGAWEQTRLPVNGTLDSEDAFELESLMREVLALALAARQGLARKMGRLPALRSATREELHRRLARAEDRMHAEYAWPLALADLARTACMSPFHFARRFAEFHGVPPHRYLSRLRLEKAREYLRLTEMPVDEVARAVGYESVPTFVRRFKLGCGCTPGAYRAGRAGAGVEAAAAVLNA